MELPQPAGHPQEHLDLKCFRRAGHCGNGVWPDRRDPGPVWPFRTDSPHGETALVEDQAVEVAGEVGKRQLCLGGPARSSG